MEKIEVVKNAAKEFRDAMAEVEKVKKKIAVKVEELCDEFNDEFTAATNKAAQLQTELGLIIENNSEFFVKPKTQNFNGCKIGYQKAKDSTLIPNEEETIALIKEKYDKKRASLMIKTEESVIIDSLKNLKDEELAELGITRNIGLDEVYIKLEDSDVSKIVKGLLKDTPLKAA